MIGICTYDKYPLHSTCIRINAFGPTSFYLQFGVEPVLHSTPMPPLASVELTEAAEYRHQHCQNTELMQPRNIIWHSSAWQNHETNRI